jgi:hypothetical protein
MNKHTISRRDFLRLAGGAALTVVGASILPKFLRKTLLPVAIADAQTVAPNLYFAGTDGWISMPPSPSIGFFFRMTLLLQILIRIFSVFATSRGSVTFRKVSKK